MAWVILIASGVLEAVWATALGKSDGFTKLWPSVIFFGALALSMGGLAWAMRDSVRSTNPGIAAMIGFASANAASKSASRPGTTGRIACSRIIGPA